MEYENHDRRIGQENLEEVYDISWVVLHQGL